MDDESIFSESTVSEPECSFWNHSVVYSSSLCSHFSLSRIANGMTNRAVDRAVKCAAKYKTDCIISPEIGLSIPAAFVFDPEHSGLRMVVAPRLIETNSEINSEIKTIRIVDQSGQSSGATRRFNTTISVEFLPGNSRTPVIEQFKSVDAFCIQMLREAFSPDCWQALD